MCNIWVFFDGFGKVLIIEGKLENGDIMCKSEGYKLFFTNFDHF